MARERFLSIGTPAAQYWFERMGHIKPRMFATRLDRASGVKVRYRVSGPGTEELARQITALAEAFIQTQQTSSYLVAAYEGAAYCRLPTMTTGDPPHDD